MELDKLRDQIDTIDEDIVALIAKRFEITSTIGNIKQQLKLKSISSERELQQFNKLKLLANKQNLSYELLQKIFRHIIDEVVQNHNAIKNQIK